MGPHVAGVAGAWEAGGGGGAAYGAVVEDGGGEGGGAGGPIGAPQPGQNRSLDANGRPQFAQNEALIQPCRIGFYLIYVRVRATRCRVTVPKRPGEFFGGRGRGWPRWVMAWS